MRNISVMEFDTPILNYKTFTNNYLALKLRVFTKCSYLNNVHIYHVGIKYELENQFKTILNILF